jgi:16S rRNA G966 N2-methylase RsmD
LRKLITKVLRRIKWLYRGVTFFLSWLILEKPRGLDFSLRSKFSLVDGYNGYAMTSSSALANIDKFAPIKGRKFLDIGSGKGAVVVNAIKLGAKFASGIEFNKKLHIVAERNFKVLKHQGKANSINIDALEFLNYSDYDYYFLFNPFESEIYSEVISRILGQTVGSKGERTLVCYGNSNLEFLNSQSRLKLTHSSICPFRMNEINIFTID